MYLYYNQDTYTIIKILVLQSRYLYYNQDNEAPLRTKEPTFVRDKLLGNSVE